MDKSNKSKGIKRHPCLKPLSRDHLVALMGAQRLMKAGANQIDFRIGIEFFLNVWNNEVYQHLLDEENILPEFIKDKTDLEQLLEDHKQLRDYCQKVSTLNLDEPSIQEKALATEAGEFLDKHVRWEEREFFPRIEKTNSVEEIEKLLALTDKVEQSRNRKKSCEPRKNTKKKNNPDLMN